MLRALLSNIQALAKNSKNKKRSGKEPYFDKKWGTNAAFNKSVDKTLYAVEKHEHTAQIHDQILVMFKTSSGDGERNEFLNKVASDSIDFLNEQRQRLLQANLEEELCCNSMATMTEHVFEILKSYAYALNNKLGYGPLHVAATNPQAVTEAVKFNSLRQPEETVHYYRARLSTTSYSLVLRGDKHGIQFFIMPVARALGLSKQECLFLPVMRLSMQVIDGSVAWLTEAGRPLTPSMVENLCMTLFQRLLEETKVELRKEEEGELDTGVSA